ncbi:MAG: tetratricopeptide repeat protein [Pseudomonadota bacterium]
MRTLIAAACVFATSATAECPDAPDISDEMDVLVSEIRAAPNDVAAREISNQMWELWLQAPDVPAQTVLDDGMRARANYDFVGAIEKYDRLVAYCPNYAEGYNQRAFVYFLTQDYASALVDLDKALALSPRHVGAQSGRALTLMNMGRLAEARRQLLEALDNNPWLSERFLLAEGGPLAEQGEDI